MPKPNYQYEKRQREMEKKKKKALRASKKGAPPEEPAPTPDRAEEPKKAD